MYSSQRFPQPFIRLALPCLLLAGFFGVCIWRLGVHPFTGDEAFSEMLAGQPLGEILARLNDDEPHPPGFYMLMHVWRSVVPGHDEFSFRYPSVLLGLALLAVMQRTGRELGLGLWARSGAAFLVAFSPQIVVHLRDARMYAAMTLGVAVALLVSVRFDRFPDQLAPWLGAAASAAALLTHYFTAPFIAALGLWGAFYYQGAARRRFIYGQALAWLALMIWLPLGGRAFLNPAALSQGKVWSYVIAPWASLPRILEVAVSGYRAGTPAWVVWGSGALLVGGWLIGSLYGPGRRHWILFLGAALPLLGYSALCWFKPVFHPKFVLPWILFAALGFGRWLSRQPRAWLAWLALSAAMAWPAWDTWHRPYDPGLAAPAASQIDPAPRDLARALTRYAGPTDVFGLRTPDVAHCFYSQVYFERDLGCALIPAFPGQSPAELGRQVAALFEQHAVLWMLDFYNPYWDPEHVADQVLSQLALDLGSEELEGRGMRLFTTSAAVIAEQIPLTARFGNVARLEGAWAREGAALHLVLVWRSLADHPDLDLKVFVQLVDESGAIVAQDDSVPVQWTRPVNTWAADEQLLDAHSLLLPPDWPRATGTLHIGLYNPTSLARLPAADSAGADLADAVVSFPLLAVVPP